MVKYLVLCALLLPAPAMAQSWQAPATPPNDIPQAVPQSYSVIGGQPAPQPGVAQPPSTQFIINNDTGAVVGTVTDAP